MKAGEVGTLDTWILLPLRVNLVRRNHFHPALPLRSGNLILYSPFRLHHRAKLAEERIYY